MTESRINSSQTNNESYIQDPDLVFSDAHLLSIILYSLIFLISSLANIANVTFMVSLNASRRTLYGTDPGNNEWRRRAVVGLPYGNGRAPAKTQTHFNAGSIVMQEYHQLAANLKRAIARKRTSTHFNSSYFRMRTLLLNLCVADLMVTFLLIPLEIAWRATVSWRAGDIACRLLMFVRIFGLYLSSFVLVCIAVDRYLSILHPLSVRYAEKRQKRMMWASWILSFLCSLPQSFIFHVATHPMHPDFKQCVTFSFFTSRLHELTYNVLCMMAMYGGPLIIILILYSKVLYKMYQSTRNMEGGLMNKQQSQSGSSTFLSHKHRCKKNEFPRRTLAVHFDEHSKIWPYKKAQFKVANLRQFYSVRSSNYRHEINKVQKMGNNRDKKQVSTNQISMQRHFDFGSIKKAQAKNLKLTIYIIIAFFCCWTPFYAMAMFFWFAPDMASKTSNYIQEIFFMFAVSNSCINPLIYGRFVCVSLRSKTWKSLNNSHVQTSPKLRNLNRPPQYSRNNFYNDPYETGSTNGQIKLNKSSNSLSPISDNSKLMLHLPTRVSSSICYGNIINIGTCNFQRRRKRSLNEDISNSLLATMNQLITITSSDKVIPHNNYKNLHNSSHFWCDRLCISCTVPENGGSKSKCLSTNRKQGPFTIRQNSILLSIKMHELKRKSFDAFSKLKRAPKYDYSKQEIELSDIPTTTCKGNAVKCFYEKTTGSNKHSKPLYPIKERHKQNGLGPSHKTVNPAISPTKYQLLSETSDQIDNESLACKRYIKPSISHDNFKESRQLNTNIIVGDSI